MPELTRRRSDNHRQDCWHIFYGDIHAGTITERVGNPHDTQRWEWRCGFYPGSHPGEHQSGTAATFDEARVDFELAWKIFLSKRTEADFQAWRDQRDWDGEKICAVGCRQKAGTRARMILRPAPQRAQAGLISAPTFGICR